MSTTPKSRLAVRALFLKRWIIIDDLIQLCSLGGLSILSSDDLDPQTSNASRLEQVAALESLLRRASTTALPPLSECLALPRLETPRPPWPGLDAGPLS